MARPALARPRCTATPTFVAALGLGVLALAGTAMAAPAAGAPGLQGRVERVMDGDSLIFRPDGGGKALEVRLHGVDAPEGCQAGGPEARASLQAMVQGQPATLQTRGRDTYGRTLGVLTVEGQVVNQRLVAEGHAWSTRSKWNQGPYVAQEKVAVALKRGLHAERDAVPPWEFRRANGRCTVPAAPR